jgi:glycosyltransferase involved in cell wall biosynthesis
LTKINNKKIVNNRRDRLNRRFINNRKNNRVKYINKKFGNQKHILLIVDVYNWAFHNIAKKIKEIDTENNYVILNLSEAVKKIKGTRSIFDNFHYAIFFWYDNRSDYILSRISNRKTKKILCLYDSSIWINSQNEKMMKGFQININKMLKKTQIVMYASDKIKYHIVNDLEISNNKLLSCYDGVDTNMFYDYGYSDSIKTKSVLTIGWIGNSNPKSQGINKGYQNIKDTIKKINNKYDYKFEFKPQDSFQNKVPHTSIPEYLQEIDIIVCFSENEGTPNQILEASSMGKCWISTNVGIVPNLNSNDDCGIVIERTEDELENALMELYNNREKIIELGKNGRINIDEWDWTNRVKQFTNIFTE